VNSRASQPKIRRFELEQPGRPLNFTLDEQRHIRSMPVGYFLPGTDADVAPLAKRK
jgi:hypothetical protein